jgi:carboxynorspermidine decarboxylase
MPDGLDLNSIPSPCYVADLDLLRGNLRTLDSVRQASGATVLLALKGFAMFGVFDICRQYLDGVCASGPHEARLGSEEFGKQVHAYAPAFSDEDMAEVLRHADHVVFNSFAQLRRHRAAVAAAAKATGREIQIGLRVNPGYSEVATELYNPCAANSRLGIARAQFEGQDLTGVDGLHFHVMCEQGSDVLERVLKVFEQQYADLIPGRRWINFGGGHHITRPGYDIGLLVRLVKDFRQRHGAEVILEPGEASALNAGVLVATVLDIIDNGMKIAILDTSAAAHMPDTLEMPYRPGIVGSGLAGELAHTYRLGGLTCLAGDVIGDYSFAEPLEVGSKIVLTDMLHYTMVKNNTFNGVKLPSIATYDPADGKFTVLRSFGYEDYKMRLS